jgi:ABC-type polysaccharide/polyol phosphate export permease
MSSRAAALYERRRTLGLLVARDLKVRYAESVLGYVWTVLEPLLMALTYWFVFTKIFTGRHVGAQPYILFLIIGLLAWNWLNGVVIDSAKALSAEAKIVRSSNLVREIWVLRIVLSKFVEFVFALPVVLIFAAAYHHRIGFGHALYHNGPYISWYVLAFPLGIVLQFVLLTGVALVLAPLSVLFNDVQRMVRILLRIGFYASPVIYGALNVPEAVKPFFALNPLSGIFELYRAAFFPSQFVGWRYVATAAVISAGTLAFGTWVFRRLEGTVLKEI